ncbi:phage tail tape measure protein [Bacillus sp. BP-3]|uniref:phage tail tape measure protein n=1 Tax=Bacillus sp. BP-3 TaxID=3022773 RepID=UPI002FEE4D8C
MAGNIKGITIQLGADTTSLQNALRDVTRQSVSLSQELKQVEKGLKFNPGNTELLAQKQQILSQQVAVTSEKLNRLKEAQAQVNQQFASGRISAEQYRAFNREIVNTEGHLNRLNGRLQSATSQMNENSRSVDNVRNHYQEAGRQIENTANKFDKFKSAGMALAGVGVGIAGALGMGVKAAADQESQLAAMETAFQGNTKAAQEYIKWAQEFGKTTPFEAKDVVDATIKLKAYGLDAKNVLTPIGNMAAGMGKGLDQAIEAVADAQTGELERLKEFGITKQMLIDKATQMGKGEIVNAQGQIKDMKSLNDALFAIMDERFKGGMDRQSKTLKGQVSALKDTMTQFAQSIGNALMPVIKPLTEFLQTLADKFNSLSPSAKTFIAVSGAIAAAIALISAPILLLIGFIPQIVAGFAMIAPVITGAFAAIFSPIGLLIAAIVGLGIIIYKNWDTIKSVTINTWNTISQFLVNLWNGVVSKASDIWGSVVEVTMNVWNGIKEFFANLWNGIVEMFTSTVNGIRDFLVQTWTTISEFFMNIWNGIVAFLTPILQGIADFFSMIWNGISTVIQTVWNFITQYLQAIWTAILYFATPIFESVKQFIVDTWNTISSTTSAVWQAVTDFLSSVWNGLVSFVTPIFESIKNFIVSVWDAISSTTSTVWNAIVGFLTGLWNGIVSGATTIFNAIKGAVESVWNWISSTSNSIWNGISSALSSVWNGIKSTASSIWEGLKESIMTPVRWVTGAVSNAFEGMKSSVLGVWDGIKSGIKVVINGIIGVINNFIDGFNMPAKALNSIPGVNAPTISHIPMLAKGGRVNGDGQFIAGEAGAELITKRGNNVTVTPLSSREKSLGITGAMAKLMNDMSRTMANSIHQLQGARVSMDAGMYGMNSTPQDVVVQLTVDQPIIVDGRTVQRVVRKEDLRVEKIDFMKGRI